MEKVSSDKSAIIPTIHLNRNDVDEIFKIISENCKSFKITSNDYSFNSIAELQKELGPKIPNLEINGYGPHILLEFKKFLTSPYLIWLYTGEDTNESLAIFFRIKEILLKKKSIFAVFPIWISIAMFIFFLLGLQTCS